MNSKIFVLLVSFISLMSFSNLSYSKKKATAEISRYKVQLKEAIVNGREGVGFFIDDRHISRLSELLQANTVKEYLERISNRVKNHDVYISNSEVKTIKHIDEINDEVANDFALFYVEVEVTGYDLEDMKVVSKETLKPYILVHVYKSGSNVKFPAQFAFIFPNELKQFIYDKTHENKITKEDKEDLGESLNEFLSFNYDSVIMEPKIIVRGEIGESHLRITMKVPDSQTSVFDYYLDDLNGTLFNTGEATSYTTGYNGILSKINPSLRWVFVIEKDGVEDTKVVTGPLKKEIFDEMYANVLNRKDKNVAQVPIPNV